MFDSFKAYLERTKAQKGQKLYADAVKSQLASIGHFPLSREIESIIMRNPLLCRVKWPPADKLDEWEKLNYLNQIHKFCKDFSSGNFETGGYLNVCPIDRLADLGTFSKVKQTKVVYERLRSIHCIKLRNIPPCMVEEIPDMLNYVFSEGVIDVYAETVVTQPLGVTHENQ